MISSHTDVQTPLENTNDEMERAVRSFQLNKLSLKTQKVFIILQERVRSI